MMKKWKSTLCILLMLFALCCTAFAGSIPIDLETEDNAQLFFAKVVAYHPNTEPPSIDVIPVKIIKGDVVLGEQATYVNPNPFYNFRIKENKAYLFARTDENNPTYMFKASSYDTKTLSLVGLEEGSGGMWSVFEHQLNDGSYEQAEAKRKEKLGLDVQSAQQIDPLPPLDSKDWIKGKTAIAYLLGGGAVLFCTLIALTVFVILRIKRKP